MLFGQMLKILAMLKMLAIYYAIQNRHEDFLIKNSMGVFWIQNTNGVFWLKITELFPKPKLEKYFRKIKKVSNLPTKFFSYVTRLFN